MTVPLFSDTDECPHLVESQGCIYCADEYQGKNVRDGFCPACNAGMDPPTASTWHVVNADGSSICAACKHEHAYRPGILKSTCDPWFAAPGVLYALWVRRRRFALLPWPRVWVQQSYGNNIAAVLHNAHGGRVTNSPSRSTRPILPSTGHATSKKGSAMRADS